MLRARLVAEEEGEEKGADVSPVNVGIGEDDDLVVAERLLVERLALHAEAERLRRTEEERTHARDCPLSAATSQNAAVSLHWPPVSDAMCSSGPFIFLPEKAERVRDS